MRVRPWPLASSAALAVLCALTGPSLAAGSAAGGVRTPAEAAGLVLDQVLAVDRVAESPSLSPAADLLAIELHRRAEDGRAVLRASFLSLSPVDLPALLAADAAAGRPRSVALRIEAPGLAAMAQLRREADGRWRAEAVPGGDKRPAGEWFTLPGDPDAVYLDLPTDPAGATGPWPLAVSTAPVMRIPAMARPGVVNCIAPSKAADRSSTC